MSARPGLPMAQSLLLLAGLPGLALAAGLALVAVQSRLDQGPAYTVAQVNDDLHHDPGAWLGRAVRVQGIAISTGCEAWTSPESRSCRQWQGIVDVVGVSLLPVSAGTPDPLLASLRRLPLAGGFVPPAQFLRWGARTSYRLRLRVAPAGSCERLPCYDAVLLDAAPGAL